MYPSAQLPVYYGAAPQSPPPEEVIQLGIATLYPDRIPPIPNRYEDWDAWTLGDLRNLIGVTLASPYLTDRGQGLGPVLDQAVQVLYGEPFNLDSQSRAMKQVMIETVARQIPQEAGEAARFLEGLFYSVTHQPPGALDIASNAVSRMPQVAADGARSAANALNNAYEALPPAAPALGGLALGALVAVVGLAVLGGKTR